MEGKDWVWNNGTIVEAELVRMKDRIERRTKSRHAKEDALEFAEVPQIVIIYKYYIIKDQLKGGIMANELDKTIEELEAEVIAELEEGHDAPKKVQLKSEPMKKKPSDGATGEEDIGGSTPSKV